MSTSTSIEWTDKTWNPVTGCDKVSPGCKHCYAEVIADRFWATQYRPVLVSNGKSIDTITTSAHEDYLANGLARARRFTDVQTHEDRLLEPLSWRKPARIFVNSMSDLFHEDVPAAFIDRVFGVMGEAKRHTFQILTKRPARMKAYFDTLRREFRAMVGDHDGQFHVKPYANVWLGVSCEDQQYADERIPLLLQTPAAVRFISAEPLLGPIDLSGLFAAHFENPADDATLDWVIVGGESGPGARPCDLAWVRSIVQQCQAAGVACFVKQLGARPVGYFDADGQTIWTIDAHGLADRKGGDLVEFPPDLQVREYPRVKVRV